MTIEEAREYLKNDHSDFRLWVEASMILSIQSGSIYEDMLLCLSRKGLPAENASLKLHSLTARNQNKNNEYIMDKEDWERYLVDKNYIKREE